MRHGMGYLALAAITVSALACGRSELFIDDDPLLVGVPRDGGRDASYDAGRDASRDATPDRARDIGPEVDANCGDCDDTVACTRDTCNMESGKCTHRPDDSLCPRGEHCDGLGCKTFAYAIDQTYLYEVELPSGAARRIGETTFLSDVALSESGILYGLGPPAAIGTIDRITAKWTQTGLLGIPTYNALDVAPDGSIYAGAGNDLVRVDTTMNGVTQVANYPNGFSSSGDIAVVEGRLLATARTTWNASDVLVEFDLGSQRATVLGNTGVRCVYGLAAYGPELYGFTCEGLVLRIDPTSGRPTTLSRGGPSYNGATSR